MKERDTVICMSLLVLLLSQSETFGIISLGISENEC